MNVLFLSPAFPPTAWRFCAALRQRGARVVSVGDEPLEEHSQVKAAVDDYVFEPRMGEYSCLKEAARELEKRHGSFDHIESNGEHWLETEAKLRGEFQVPGLQLAALQQQRSKLGMAALFAAGGIPYPSTTRATDPETVHGLAAQYGFPLVFKPETGSGALYTFPVSNANELEHALERKLEYHVVQPFIHGDIVTYDGLTDRDGNIVFATSHVYDVGIMQLRQAEGSDGHYYSLREVPTALSELGERAVRAFDVRSRFFHIEFFAQPGGSYVALEMNLRPPGGFTTDLMNYAMDIDVYDLWASILTGEHLSGSQHRLLYHTAHAGRRRSRKYRISDAELRSLLGDTLMAVRPVDPYSADTMGDDAYLLRHSDLTALKAALALVQSVESTQPPQCGQFASGGMSRSSNLGHTPEEPMP